MTRRNSTAADSAKEQTMLPDPPSGPEQGSTMSDQTSRETARRVLDLPMSPNDAEATTVRDYLIKLLGLAWEERDGFDGKRPFGNSSWEFEVYDALVIGGLITDPFDDRLMADALVAAAIRELGPARTFDGGVDGG
jgi:hypothetical protein